MKSPLVSREAYDVVVAQLERAEQRVDALTQLVATMRRDGFTASKPGKVREAPDVERDALHRSEQDFIARVRAELVAKTGVDVGTAEREAQRLYREANDFQPTSVSDG